MSPRLNIFACLASVIVAACLLVLVFFQIVSAYSIPNHGVTEVFHVWALMAFWVVVITVLPAIALIYLAERRAWRSAILYSAAGALLALPVVFWFEVQIVLECVGIGAVAGLTYWAIAGRTAGLRDKASA